MKGELMRENIIFIFIFVIIVVLLFIKLKWKSKNNVNNYDNQPSRSITVNSNMHQEKPFEISIPVELLPENTLNGRKLYEIRDPNVIARITEIVPALVNTVAKAVTKKGMQSVGDVYRAVIPSGATLEKSKQMEGAVRGFYSNGKGIAGQANLLKVDSSQLNKVSQVANVMNVASLVVGQYYMSEVNNKLETMNKNISEISDFQEREFKSKIFSLIARVGKISKFSSDILENEELRKRKLYSLDIIEGESVQLLQQVNLTIEELSQNDDLIDYKTYEKKLDMLSIQISYQKILISLLEEISKLMYSLNRGAVNAEICHSMLNEYLGQSNKSLSKLVEWHEQQKKIFGIEIDKHRYKKYGIEGFVAKVPGMFNNNWTYKPLDENIEKKIISQTSIQKIKLSSPEELLSRNVEIINQDGKLYYLK